MIASSPVLIDDSRSYTAIGVSGLTVCALYAAGTPQGLVRWGGARYEELPYEGLEGLPIADIESGGCMRLADGQTYCLGEVQPVRP